jgi:hypothetical protein
VPSVHLRCSRAPIAASSRYGYCWPNPLRRQHASLLIAAWWPKGFSAGATNSEDRFPFGVVVTQKLAAQAVPVIGAIGVRR